MICGCGSWINLQREEMPAHPSRGSYERDGSYGSETQSMRLQEQNHAKDLRHGQHGDARYEPCSSWRLTIR
jgi:hypothetical protein